MSSSVRLTREQANQIFLQNYNFVRSVAFKNAPSLRLQDDIAHDVYLVFVEKAEQWDYDPGRVKYLLKRITEIVTKQYWNKHLRQLPERLRQASEYIKRYSNETIDLESLSIDQQMYALQLCLSKLSEENRQLIEQYYEQRVSSEILSQITGTQPGSVRMKISRLRTILHDCVEKALKTTEEQP